ncbi:hypothetical protein HPB47_009183, partial [Ixodes persulcatus]
TMYRITCAILFAGFIAASTCLSAAREDGDLLDALAHKDTKKLGEEAIQLGEILRKCAKNLKNESIIQEFPGDEAEEYFFRKTWERIKSSVKDAVREAKENIKNSVNDAAMDAKKTIMNCLKKAAMDSTVKITEGVMDAAIGAKEKIKNSVKDAAREALEKVAALTIPINPPPVFGLPKHDFEEHVLDDDYRTKDTEVDEYNGDDSQEDEVPAERIGMKEAEHRRE